MRDDLAPGDRVALAYRPPRKAQPRPRRRSGRWISLVAAASVVLVAAVAAALVADRHPVSRPLTRGALTGHHPAGGRDSAPARQPAGHHPAGSHNPATGSHLITVAPAAADTPEAGPVAAILTRYFAAINGHDFRAYQRLFGRAVRGELSAAAFGSGYGSTRDSGAVLRSIRMAGPGELAATVTFTSHQQPATSATNSACTRWRITLYLVRQGAGYVLTSPPAAYRAAATSCS
jgi:hypothetical protein